MSDEIELVSDGTGVALFGDAGAIEQFLAASGVASKDIAQPHRSAARFSAAAGIAQAGSGAAANAGRWVKLTEESAKAMKVGTLMKGSSGDVSRAVLTSDKGKITGLLEIVKSSPTGMLTNPALLAGVAGIMAQLAMQQTMDEITDYLAAIDAKVDDVLRAQKDAAVAQLIGVGFVLDEAMAIRESTGRVSETTWSKVQATTQTIAQAQGYALLQLDALAEKVEKQSKVGDIAKTSKEAEAKTREWLAVLARSFQLQDGIAVLELDRVLDADPAELDSHRRALQAARVRRRAQISDRTERLVARMDAAAGTANAQVLFHPLQSGAVISSSNHVATDVIEFNGSLGIESGRQVLEAKRWTAAAVETRDKVLETSADGVEAARRLGSRTFESARSTTSRLSSGLGDRLGRFRRSDPRTAGTATPDTDADAHADEAH